MQVFHCQGFSTIQALEAAAFLSIVTANFTITFARFRLGNDLHVMLVLIWPEQVSQRSGAERKL